MSITIVNENPSRQQLDHFDYPIGRLFELLGIKTVLELFACLLLEMQILLESQSYESLMLVAESITCLLYPFKWIHVYVPILSQQMYRYVDAPVPYLMGICVGDPLTNAALEHNNLNASFVPDLCRVRIDDARIECSRSIPSLPHADHLKLELEKVFDHKKVDVSGAIARNAAAACDSSPVHLSLPHESALRRYQRRREQSALMAIRTADCDPPSPPGSASLHSLREIGNLIERSRIKLSVRLGEQTAINAPVTTASVHDQYFNDMKLNNAIRQVFLTQFVNLFYNYESYMIRTGTGTGSACGPASLNSLEMFDKVAFLSDQPQQFYAFLNRFLDTQIFMNFVESRSVTRNGDLFDWECCRLLKRSNETHGYKPCTTIQETERLLDEKYTNPDFTVRPFDETAVRLQQKLSEKRPQDHQLMVTMDRNKNRQTNESNRRNRQQNELLSKNLRESNRILMTKFLNDCKMKTKRIVLSKLHDEGIETTNSSTSRFHHVIEENIQIILLCDFLERVWSHGIRQKLSKSSSALWSYLTAYEKRQKSLMTSMSTTKPVKLSKSIIAMELSSTLSNAPKPKQLLAMPPSDLLYDLKKVRSLTDIKTEMGLARAWVRLVLEKKQLAESMQILLSSHELLQLLYKETAFVRFRSGNGTGAADDDDLIEQFLFHLFSLNAVDFYTFTNSYRSATVPYQIVIEFGDYDSVTDDGDEEEEGEEGEDDDDEDGDSDDDFIVPGPIPLWLQLNGSFESTEPFNFSAHRTNFMIRSRNLGVLTSVQIGLCGNSDRDFKDVSIRIRSVHVRDEITGRVTRFPCRRRRLDQTVQRLLAMAYIPGTSKTPVSRNSCSIPSAQNLQSEFANVSNQILKWFSWNAKKIANGRRVSTVSQNALFALVHRPQNGLLVCLQAIFRFGFRQQSISLFRIRNYSLWDYLIMNRDCLNGVLVKIKTGTLESTAATRTKTKKPTTASLSLFKNDHNVTRKYFLHVLDEIVTKANGLACDDKFRLFLCVAIRDRQLAAIIERILAEAQITRDFYDANQSFLRNRSLSGFLVQMLQKLNAVPLEFDSSTTHGIKSIVLQGGT